jgi:polyribonucleotide nucleotidyltransferase
VKDVRDELKEGEQILVKVLALEGNKIKLSRKAVLAEQRDKLRQGDGVTATVSSSAASTDKPRGDRDGDRDRDRGSRRRR